MDHLTEEQRVALEQLRSITNSSDDDVTAGVLQSVDWDVQVNCETLN
jgi:FAS-associated factor 2